MKTKLVDCTALIDKYMDNAEMIGRVTELNGWVFCNDHHILGEFNTLEFEDLMDSITKLAKAKPRFRTLALHWDGAFMTIFNLTPAMLKRGMERFCS
jgi:hypothetical protein